MRISNRSSKDIGYTMSESSVHGSKKLVVVLDNFCSSVRIAGSEPSSLAILSMVRWICLFTVILHLGRKDRSLSASMSWLMYRGRVLVTKWFVFDSLRAECKRVKVHVVLDFGLGGSLRKEVPGS